MPNPFDIDLDPILNGSVESDTSRQLGERDLQECMLHQEMMLSDTELSTIFVVIM